MNNNEKIMEILTSIFNINVDSVTEIKVQMEIGQIVLENYKQDNKYENLDISIFVKDTSKMNWKPKDHFTKIFNIEMKSAAELYDLKKSEVLFLYSLSPYLLWETNLLVDEENNPINQKKMAELMEVDRKTIQRHMKALEEKKCIVRICLDKNTYYMVNPYLMFCGQKINKQIPKLFDLIGFKSSRVNRRETVENRHKVS